MQVGERKQRSDRKRDIKPTVSLKLKNVLWSISNLTYIPVKDVGQHLTILVLKDRKSIEYLARYFKRDFQFQNTVFYGFIENENAFKNIKSPSEKKDRVTIRFSQEEHEMLARLSFALDCSVSFTVALLLQIATQNIRFINAFIKQYLQSELNERQMKDLREVLTYVNSTGDSHHTWASLLALVREEIGNPLLSLSDTVGKFIKKKWN